MIYEVSPGLLPIRQLALVAGSYVDDAVVAVSGKTLLDLLIVTTGASMIERSQQAFGLALDLVVIGQAQGKLDHSRVCERCPCFTAMAAGEFLGCFAVYILIRLLLLGYRRLR